MSHLRPCFLADPRRLDPHCRPWPTLLGLALFALASVPVPSLALDLYVATTGKDTWSGKLASPNSYRTDGPFATLERARTAIRDARAKGLSNEAITVRIRAGTYRPSQPFVLSSIDSGRPGFPVTYRAYGDGAVILSGARPLTSCYTSGSMQRCSTSGLPLDTLTPMGDSRYAGNVPQFEVFYGGQRLTLARWPNATGQGPGSAEWMYIAGTDSANLRDRLRYGGDRPRRWGRPTEAQLHIWPGNDWYDQYVGIQSLSTSSREIRLASKVAYDLVPGRRFYVRNVREELDAPGEWYYDRVARQLQVYPPTAARYVPEASILDNVLILDNASHVVLDGLTIEGSRKTGVEIANGSSNKLINSRIRNTGGDGVRVRSGTNHTVQRCEVHDTGRGGVLLQGGDRSSLVAAGHVAADNHIHRMGRLIMTYQPAIALTGVGNRAVNNYVHDGPHAGITLEGNNHLIERNDLHDLCSESSDCGAFYTGRDWTYRGNVIRHNKFHDLYGYGLDKVDPVRGEVTYTTPNGVRAVYLDDGMSGFRVEGNTFYRVGLAGVHVGGGRDNIIANNVFVDPAKAIWVDARWATYNWQANIDRNATVPTQSLAWTTSYPELAAPMNNYKWPENNRIECNIIATLNPRAGTPSPLSYVLPQSSTTIDRNLAWTSSGATLVSYHFLDTGATATVLFPAWQQTGFDRASLAENPAFRAPALDDYTLDSDSPAFRLGFNSIPYETIASGLPVASNPPTTDRMSATTYRFRFDGTRVSP